MDIYMRENKLQTVEPQLPPPQPPGTKKEEAGGAARRGDGSRSPGRPEGRLIALTSRPPCARTWRTRAPYPSWLFIVVIPAKAGIHYGFLER
jgi:hypothetical protein